MFIHENNYEPFPDVRNIQIGSMRFYLAPDGLKYPSITTVLGRRPGKQEGLQKWRDRIGEQEARKISMKAARRGTAFHYMAEDFLNNELKEDAVYRKNNLLAWAMFKEAQPHIENSVNKIVLQEQSMYSPDYKIAGRVDVVGEYNGKLAVMDFKTTTTMKKEEWIEDYFIQCTSYAVMFEYHTGEPVNTLVIIMIAEDGDVRVFEKNTQDYIPKLVFGK